MLSAMCLTYSCQPEQATKGNNGIYPTLTVQLSKYVSESKYPAALRGIQHVTIRPRVPGTIKRICIEEGAHVVAGQCLFIIDPVPYQAALRQAEAQKTSAEAQVATARMHYEARERLHRDSIVSDYDLLAASNELATAEAALAMAKAQLVKAQQDLSYTEVCTPTNGRTGMFTYHVGDVVETNQALLTVSDDRTVHAYFSISERQVLDLTKRFGSLKALLKALPEVGLELSNGQRYDKKGEIDAISGIIDPTIGTVQLRAAFENPDRLLRNGGSAQLLLPISIDSAIVIPRAATFEVQNKVFCYRVIEGKAVQTELETDPSEDGRNYLVMKGLKEGDVIISKGAGLVKNGATVVRAEDAEK